MARWNKSSAPSSPSVYTTGISNFKGVDFANSPTAMDFGRSPDAPNMVRAHTGKVRKRLGYHTQGEYVERINGIYSFGGSLIVHAGTRVFIDGSACANGLEDAVNGIVSTAFSDTKSSAIAFGRSNESGMDDRVPSFVLFDGSNAWILCSEESDGVEYKYLASIKDKAYCPLIIIARDPSGGGTAYYDVNLVSDSWKESFAGTKTDTEYQLTLFPLSDDEVYVKVLGSDGITWNELTENVDFTVDRETGVVSFTTAPGTSAAVGEDNVVITASMDRSEKRRRITGCITATTYGDSGIGNRIFCTGNPDYPNRDFWSALNDATYFPDLNYSVLGGADSAIVGYSVLGSYLCAHKDHKEGTIYVRAGSYDSENDEMNFPIVNIVRGPASCASKSHCFFIDEPLFLTERGIYAITTTELTQERYEQRRSHYIDPRLTKEENLQEAVACVYGDYYVLAINECIYLLDGTAKDYSKDEPYATFQYECFFLPDIPVRSIATINNTLYFGDTNGNLYAFAKDETIAGNYNDNGNAIEAYWQTADFQGRAFYHNKHFRRCAIQLEAAAATGVTAECRVLGLWREMFSDYDRARHFRFSQLTFSKLTFSCDTSAQTIIKRMKVRKADKAGFRFRNSELNEPYGLEQIAFEYTETGNYKG